jgi:hypothetical protein
MCPRVWPGVWIAVKPGTDIGPSAVSASSTGTGSGRGMMAATTRIKPFGGRAFATPVISGASIAWATTRGPGPATQFGHAADVIGMTVRQQDRVDLADRSPCGLDGTRHLVGSPGDSGVHQHHAVIDDDGVCVHVANGNFNHAVDDFAHLDHPSHER